MAIATFATSGFGTRLHLRLFRATGGRMFRRFLGCDIVILTTTGRRSGRALDAPLVAVEDGEAWVVVASNGGKDRAPGWLLNLRADPAAFLQVGPEHHRVRAREATPEEVERLWPRVVGLYGGYETYRRRTERDIPLVLLERDVREFEGAGRGRTNPDGSKEGAGVARGETGAGRLSR